MWFINFVFLYFWQLNSASTDLKSFCEILLRWRNMFNASFFVTVKPISTSPTNNSTAVISKTLSAGRIKKWRSVSSHSLFQDPRLGSQVTRDRREYESRSLEPFHGNLLKHLKTILNHQRPRTLENNTVFPDETIEHFSFLKEFKKI